MKRFVATAVVGALALTSTSFAQFSDGFEAYPLGILPPQGGWVDFGGTQPITVSNVRARTGSNSMRLLEGPGGGTTPGYGSDVFKNFLPAGVINTGQWNFSYWQFMETTVDTVSFMYISTGRLPATFQTGLDLRGDPINGSGAGVGHLVVQDINGVPTLVAAPATLVRGRWVEHNLTIDLGANTYSYSYDGTALVPSAQWDRTPGDGVSLGGFNFWMQLGNANGVNDAVYFDDFNLVQIPAPGGIGLVAAAGVFGLRRRRR